MSQNIYPNNIASSNDSSGEVIDVKKIVGKIILNWHLFFISIFICLAGAFIYLYRTLPDWNITSKIIVKDSKNNPQGGMGGSISGDLGSLFNAKSSADNEIQILKSRTLAMNTVRALQLNVRTYQINGLKKIEIFEQNPFKVILTNTTDTLEAREFDIEVLNSKEYVIKNAVEEVEKRAQFGKPLKLSQYTLNIFRLPVSNTARSFKIAIESPDITTDGFMLDFKAALSDKQATTIDLGYSYPNPAKGEAVLNTLMRLYLASNIEIEKQTADSTMAFIDSRIALVSSELNNIEKQFEQYKTRNNLANIGEQSKAMVSSAADYYDKLAQQETQLNIISEIEKSLKKPDNRNFIPSSLINSTDQSFGLAINTYNDLLRSRDKASLSYTNDNPIIQNLDEQIENSRLNLLRNFSTYRRSLELGKNELQKQNSGFIGQLKQLPGKERNYLDFARQQNLKQELYLYLLQKREETAISRNSTISSSRIVDMAKSEYKPYKPKKSIIYLIGLICGVVIPTVYLLIKDLLNIRISSKSDITSVTPVGIVGEIGHNSDKQSLVAGINSRSVISEQFRSLRTNLQFVLGGAKSNVILFTSSMSGEGKSFLSLNLGSALALTGKKVVFMEMDLRKPKLSESVGLTVDNGFTNYAISEDENYNFQKLLKPLSFNKNCFLISSGPIPPNPAELLENGKFEQLINYLRNEFDYVIIDCAPVGLVTDALMLEKQANLTLYVTRHGYTYKSQLDIVNDLIQNKKLKNLYLIVNDIKTETAGYSSYRQAYGYGHQFEEQSWLDKLKFWKSK